MKRLLIQTVCLLLSAGILSSCAVMFGSTNYVAKVEVANHGKAEIVKDGAVIGKGNASTVVKRSDAQRLTFVVKEDGCEDQTFNYNTGTLRGWSIAGTVFTWGLVGIAVDGATGAWWKPNVNNPTITKQDYKNYTYKLNYTGCKDK